ncbi:MAG: hypothetical protein WCT11_04935 [Candidatus Magasanikbacteria bacterium]|jgi:hypothetical protein
MKLFKIKKIEWWQNFKNGWQKLKFFEKNQIVVMAMMGFLAFIVAWKQASLSGRLLQLEEKNKEPILSIEVGEYTQPTTNTIRINPIFYNVGSVPVNIIGTGFHIYKETAEKSIFSLIYGRGMAGMKIGPGNNRTLPYEISTAEDILALYRFDIIYKEEYDWKEKCETIILPGEIKNSFKRIDGLVVLKNNKLII